MFEIPTAAVLQITTIYEKKTLALVVRPLFATASFIWGLPEYIATSLSIGIKSIKPI